jgi:hypothetical protein
MISIPFIPPGRLKSVTMRSGRGPDGFCAQASAPAPPARRQNAIAVQAQERGEGLDLRRVVFHQKNDRRLRFGVVVVAPQFAGPLGEIRVGDHQREHGSLAGIRPHVDLIPEQISEALHDVEAESKAGSSRAILVDAVEFIEYRLEVGLLNADAGVPDLDPQDVPSPPATDQDSSLVRIFDGVGQKIAEHAGQQAAIAGDGGPHRHAAQFEAPGLGKRIEIADHRSEERWHRKVRQLRLDGAALDLLEVEQRVDQFAHLRGRVAQL